MPGPQAPATPPPGATLGHGPPGPARGNPAARAAGPGPGNPAARGNPALRASGPAAGNAVARAAGPVQDYDPGPGGYAQAQG